MKNSLLEAKTIDLEGFKAYLAQGRNATTAAQRLAYAMEFSSVLITGNAEPLQSLSLSKRLHVMKSLALLAKYTGKYDEWRKTKERYALKWTQYDDLYFFKNMTADGAGYDALVKEVSSAVKSLPRRYANIVRFTVLTGLRTVEALNSIRLLHSDSRYHNANSGTLEHFQFPQVFLRRTKKAYVSVVDDDIIAIGKGAAQLTYRGFWDAMHSRKIDFHARNARKLYGTFLRNQGITAEVIDLVQGRVPKSVFARFYYRINFKQEADRIRDILPKLRDMIN